MCFGFPMVSMNAAKPLSTPGQQVWTDQTLCAQMSMLNMILLNAHVDLKYLSSQCLFLSKIIDSLVACNRKPIWRADLLPLVRKMCKYKDSPDARSALFILLLSVKEAFRAEWLSSVRIADNDEIFSTLKLLFDSFTTSHDCSVQAPAQLLESGGSAVKDFQDARVYLDSISNRFFPRLQVQSVFVAVHAKVGYEVLMCDFYVPPMHDQDRVRLYAGQKEKTETSTCIVTPQQVNIFVNGQEVEKRVVTDYIDTGPQMPSDVTNLVKVGSNVLQAIGEFSVSYIIAVALSRPIERSSKNAELQDYVAPPKAASEVDPTEVEDEVVEGASRVSLRCPISHQRLVMPVKATTCRHLQCFDYDSYLEINENRPAWRCPCCNSFISWPDLRIDRQMEMVLKDTDDKIHEVIFNQDGSWIPVSTNNETDRGPNVTTIDGGEDGSTYIDLSDDEEPNGARQKTDVFSEQERKPDAQTLQTLLEDRGNSSHTTNPMAQQRDIAGHPVINVPELTTVASRSSPRFSGNLWLGGGITDGVFLNNNGGGVYTRTSGPVDNPIQNQPVSSIQPTSAGSHDFQVRFPRTTSRVNSPAGPINRLAPNTGHTTFSQLHQPQSSALPNIGHIAENGWVQQRQVGQQQSPGTSQNVQDLGQMRPQWRSTGVPSRQPGTNVAQPHNLHSAQQFHPSQSQGLHPPHQFLTPRPFPPHQHASPENLQQQHPSPLTSHQQHSIPVSIPQQQQGCHGNSQQQRPIPEVISQGRPGVWVNTNRGHWLPTGSLNQARAVGGIAAATSEQNWRPTQRMRGSIPNPPLGTNPAALPQQRASAVNATFPSTQTQSYNIAATSSSASVPRFQGGAPVRDMQAASNVSLYNGTTWVNAPDFSTPPATLFTTNVPVPEGWLRFEDLDLPELP